MKTAGERDLETKRRAARHPERPGERCNAEPAAWAPVVDYGHCEGKRACVVVCPKDVFEVRRMHDEDFAALGPFQKFRATVHRRQSAYPVRADACRACGLCVVACPDHAITLVAAGGGSFNG